MFGLIILMCTLTPTQVCNHGQRCLDGRGCHEPQLGRKNENGKDFVQRQLRGQSNRLWWNLGKRHICARRVSSGSINVLFFKWGLNFQLSADEYVLSYERFWEAGAPFSGGAHWLSLLIIHVIIILIINITNPLPCGVDIRSLLIPFSYHHYEYQ